MKLIFNIIGLEALRGQCGKRIIYGWGWMQKFGGNDSMSNIFREM